MNTTHPFVLPEPQMKPLRAVLRERFEQAARSVNAENFGALLDPLMREVLEAGFNEATADEGTLWLLSPEGDSLVPVCNTGPSADRFVGQFRQPLNAGLICMVFASEQPFMENDVPQDARQSKLLDDLLHLRTRSLIAVPFYFFNACRGVVSGVQLEPARGKPAPPGFEPRHIEAVTRAAATLSRLIEWRLAGETLGLGNAE
jgi:GAF domain-containing protein